ncbi:MAG: hypothetical protein IPK10_12725 [Bacteroidetes bacterium]|nr:hypothetical protein [Bacteroidota bacterium]
MTGWSDLAELAERIYHYGNNTTMSNIWPMFSAEDSFRCKRYYHLFR